MRFRHIAVAAAFTASILAGSLAAHAQGGELRLAMTAGDIPTSKGAPDQGGEGIRWMGFTIYDSLLYWNLNQEETLPVLVPALAEKWAPNPENRNEWIFDLRKGVKFHDGSDFNADAVIWNIEKLLVDKAPQFDIQQRVALLFRIPGIKKWRKIDDYRIGIADDAPNTDIPNQVPFLHISSPAHWAKVGGWEEFAKNPSGTGPFKVERIVVRERAVLVRNDNYWDPARKPKLDRLILLPLPEASTRVSALLSGQVNFIEAPSPDAIPRLKQAGMIVKTNAYPHIWPYILRISGENTPLKDVRVRQALNLAVNRDEVVQLLGGTATPAYGHVLPDSPWFGKPAFKIGYDPERAKALLKEAGYGPGNPLKIKFMISPSGSGQMQPLPMNELVQQQIKAIGVDLEFEVNDWQALRAQRAKGPLDPGARNIHALNNSMSTPAPFEAFDRFFSCKALPPAGLNWGGVCDEKLEAMLTDAGATFDVEEQNRKYTKVHEYVVDNAYWLWVVHDTNPRALNPKVKGFSQAKSWYQDLTQIYVEK